MLKAQFSDADEFFDEIGKDRERLRRGIVRVTRLRRNHGDCITFAVLATAIVEETLLHLNVWIGDCHRYDQDNRTKLWQQGLEQAAALTEKLLSLNVDVRNGAWQTD